jgi:hypothetical protein
MTPRLKAGRKLGVAKAPNTVPQRSESNSAAGNIISNIFKYMGIDSARLFLKTQVSRPLAL